jgi:N-methylhydantoinase B
MAGGTASLRVSGVGAEEIGPGSWLLRAGDVVSIVTAGSGGYGDPRQRELALVEADLRDGKISVEQARDAYGVDPTDPGLKPWADATKPLRG